MRHSDTIWRNGPCSTFVQEMVCGRRHQAITSINADVSITGPLGTNFIKCQSKQSVIKIQGGDHLISFRLQCVDTSYINWVLHLAISKSWYWFGATIQTVMFEDTGMIIKKVLSYMFRYFFKPATLIYYMTLSLKDKPCLYNDINTRWRTYMCWRKYSSPVHVMAKLLGAKLPESTGTINKAHNTPWSNQHYHNTR